STPVSRFDTPFAKVYSPIEGIQIPPVTLGILSFIIAALSMESNFAMISGENCFPVSVVMPVLSFLLVATSFFSPHAEKINVEKNTNINKQDALTFIGVI